MLQVAMIGGGSGSFIGQIHRMAMRLDNHFELVAGAFSSDPQRAMENAQELGLGSRGYGSWQELVTHECGKVDCIVIVTPNDSHAEIATAALKAGFHIVLEKPMCRTLEEATLLAEVASKSKGICCMAYTYTGYPMIRNMRERILAGEIGAIRTVSVDYRQGWLAMPIELEGQKQAVWRTDPAIGGTGVLGDIGSHGEQLARFTTGLSIQQVRGDVHTLVHGRKVDDHVSVQFKMEQGVIGDMVCSQVCTGDQNHVSIRVWGDQGSLSWTHDRSDELVFTSQEGTQTTTHCSTNRAPSGHPAGFVEAFANIYSNFAQLIEGEKACVISEQDGLASMKFIDAVLRSNEEGSWSAL